MPDSLSILLLTALISFVGSVHPGPVNLAVVQATLSRNFKVGIWVAISGTLPEIIYTIIALKSQVFLAKNQAIFEFLELAIIPFFLIIGIHSLYTASKSAQNIQLNQRPKQILNGFVGGMLNPQLLPFWVVVLVYLNSFFSLESFSSQFSFVMGAALGAFLILLIFAYLTNRFQVKILGLFGKYAVNKVIGLFFISMALFQTFKILL
ncbi:MAG: LysE family transporter [Spirosomaceae bacterium]|jgi:threonine/homoserine/homoserine lactone efflux protein|nr:LysE family transporter [Spirosomataceae bacterium]